MNGCRDKRNTQTPDWYTLSAYFRLFPAETGGGVSETLKISETPSLGFGISAYNGSLSLFANVCISRPIFVSVIFA